MGKLIIGLFFILTMIPAWIVIMSYGEYGALILVLIVDIFGLVMVIKGAKVVIRNHNTKKKGIETYAQIIEVSNTGKRNSDDESEKKGKFIVYNPNTYQTETVSEVLGYGYDYKIWQVVKVKYYNGDINITEYVDRKDVPGDISKFFSQNEPTYPELIGKTNQDGITERKDNV